MASRNSRFSTHTHTHIVEDQSSKMPKGRVAFSGGVGGVLGIDAKSKLNRRHWRPLFNTQIDTQPGTGSIVQRCRHIHGKDAARHSILCNHRGVRMVEGGRGASWSCQLKPETTDSQYASRFAIVANLLHAHSVRKNIVLNHELKYQKVRRSN